MTFPYFEADPEAGDQHLFKLPADAQHFMVHCARKLYVLHFYITLEAHFLHKNYLSAQKRRRKDNEKKRKRTVHIWMNKLRKGLFTLWRSKFSIAFFARLKMSRSQ